MFSHIGISGNKARFWKISAVGRWFGRMPRMSRPPIRTAPWVGSMKPEIIRRMVVLPQPEGPRKEKNSPALIVTSTLSTARKAPKSIRHVSSWTSSLIVPYRLGRLPPQSKERASRRRLARFALTPPGYLSAYSLRSVRNSLVCVGHHHSLLSASPGYAAL